MGLTETAWISAWYQNDLRRCGSRRSSNKNAKGCLPLDTSTRHKIVSLEKELQLRDLDGSCFVRGKLSLQWQTTGSFIWLTMLVNAWGHRSLWWSSRIWTQRLEDHPGLMYIFFFCQGTCLGFGHFHGVSCHEAFYSAFSSSISFFSHWGKLWKLILKPGTVGLKCRS